MRKKIIVWLRQRVKLAKAKGLVLGLSGGLDSCVAAVLAKEALGKKRVLALIMPCHSQKEDLADARVFAKKFGINTKLVNLTEIYNSLDRILPPADRMSLANIRPRLRMIVLYYFARRLKFLVCGTSNKTELTVGYFTKFGDGASDIMPLGGLYKTQVRRLAKELKVPEKIITKPPTAGLWPGQTDEGEMGITYPELDDILERLEKKKKQVLPKTKVDKVRQMIEGSQHKRQMAAICKM